MVIFLYMIIIIQSQYQTTQLFPDFRRIYSSIYGGSDGFDAYYRVKAGKLSAQNLILRLQFAVEREPIPLLNQSMFAQVTLLDEHFSEISGTVSVDVPFDFKDMERIGYFVASTISLAPLKESTKLTIKLHYEGNATYINGMHFNIGAVKNKKVYDNMISSGDILSFAALIAAVVAIVQGVLLLDINSLYVVALSSCAIMAAINRTDPILTATWQAALICCIRALAPAVCVSTWWKSLLLFIIIGLINAYPVYHSEILFSVTAGDWLTPLGWGLPDANELSRIFIYGSALIIVISFVYACFTKRGTKLVQVGTVVILSLAAMVSNNALCQRRMDQYELKNATEPEVKFPAEYFQDKYTIIFAGVFLSLFIGSPLEFNERKGKKQTDENEYLLSH